MTNENVSENTTPLPYRARLPRTTTEIDPGYLISAAGVHWQRWTQLDTETQDRIIDASDAGANKIAEARRNHGRHGQETALVEVGALLSVALAAKGMYSGRVPPGLVLHASDERVKPPPTHCSSCGGPIYPDGCYCSPPPPTPPPNDRGPRCAACAHHWDEHTRSIEGPSGCDGDAEAYWRGCDCPGFEGAG